jgi:hypothetical protein
MQSSGLGYSIASGLRERWRSLAEEYCCSADPPARGRRSRRPTRVYRRRYGPQAMLHPMQQRASRRSDLALLTSEGAIDGERNEAARVSCGSRRRGSRAAGRRCAAAHSDAPRWRVDAVPRARPALSATCDGLRPGAVAVRVGRGWEYPDRLPLRGGRSGALRDLRGRVSRPGPGCNSCKHPAGRRGIAAAYAHNTYRFCAPARSRRAGLC